MAFGGYPATDARGAGIAVLPALYGAVPRHRRTGSRARGRGAQTVAGVGLLQPCPQPPCCREAGRVSVRRGVPCHVRGGARAARRGRLYCGGRLLDRLRRPVRGGRRECIPGVGTAFRYRDPDRYDGREEGVRRVGTVAAGYFPSGTLQPGDHGFRGSAMYPRAAPVRGLPPGWTVPRPGCGHGGRASRKTGAREDARPLVQLPARDLRRADAAAPSRRRRYLAGVV